MSEDKNDNLREARRIMANELGVDGTTLTDKEVLNFAMSKVTGASGEIQTIIEWLGSEVGPGLLRFTIQQVGEGKAGLNDLARVVSNTKTAISMLSSFKELISRMTDEGKSDE